MGKTRVVVVGAGFGGIKAVKRLARDASLEITLIDRRNHHLFQPLLYQVATAALSPSDIAFPVRALFSSQRNVSVRMEEVVGVDRQRREVHTADGSFPYDYLVLACGATHSYFNHPEWEEHAPGLKSLEQATAIRRRILTAFEEAEKEADESRRARLLTFVVVGGGPTGVELAGAIAEISRTTLAEDFRRIDPTQTRVVLVEAGSRLLSVFPEPLSQRARTDLADLGVEVVTGKRVTHLSADGVALEGEPVPAGTVLWAAGVKPSPLGALLGTELDRLGRPKIQPDLSLPGDPRVFVVGDMACLEGPDGQPLPGLAPVAMQQGDWAARNLLADVKGKPRRPFRYLDKGSLATVGRKRAVGEYKGLRFEGTMAWLIWIFVHVYYLIGFKNKFFVFWQWVWSYLTFKRGARLIVGDAAATPGDAHARPDPSRAARPAQPMGPAHHDGATGNQIHKNH